MQYVIDLEDLDEFRPNEYEFVRFAHGHKLGFDAATVLLTETKPGGGPTPHLHPVEEIHVLGAGTARYEVGDDRFDVTGPALLRLPPDIPHRFVNTGTELLLMTCFMPTADLKTSFRPDLARPWDQSADPQ